MLQAMRDRIMGVVGWIILGILTVAFAFFGLNSYLQSNIENYAARINEIDIPPQRHQMAYQRLVERMRATLGDSFSMASVDEKALRKAALDQLIAQELLVQAADRSGFSASEQLLAGQIRGIDAFQEDGRFSRERFEQVLRYQGMNEDVFVGGLYREIMASHLESGIVNTATVTEADLAAAWKLQAQQRRFDYLVLPAAGVSGQVGITDDEVSAWYEEHSSRFMTDERLRIQYLLLDMEKITPLVEIDEAAITALYESQADKYVTPEERHARHILITSASGSEQDIEAARATAQEVVKRLQEGEDFGTLAGEVSEDLATASSGGDLGYFGRGIMDPAFEEAVFSMQSGDSSEIVQSSFGFHIIELLDVRPEQATPLDEVREELVRELQQEDRDEIFYEQSERLANLTFEQPDTLQPAADELGLELVESGWITRGGGEGVAATAAVSEAAFSDDVLLNGNNSTLLEVETGKVLVLRVLEHESSRPMSLDEARDEVTVALRAERSRQLLNEQATQLGTELETGKSLQELAGALELEVVSTGLLQRNSPTPPREILDMAFRMARPADMGTVGGGLLASDDYVLIVLHEVKDGDLAALPEAQRVQARRSLGTLVGKAEMQSMMDAIRAQAVIEIPEESDI